MSRHGKLAPGKTRVTIVMPESLKAELEAIAESDNRSFSNFIETRLQLIVQEEQASYAKAAKKKKVAAMVHVQRPVEVTPKGKKQAS